MNNQNWHGSFSSPACLGCPWVLQLTTKAPSSLPVLSPPPCPWSRPKNHIQYSKFLPKKWNKKRSIWLNPRNTSALVNLHVY
jgi:hypothetical protein